MLRLNLRLKVLIFTIAIIVILLLISHIITSTLVAQNLKDRLQRRAMLSLENLEVWLSDKNDQVYKSAKLLANTIAPEMKWQDPLWIWDWLNRNPDRTADLTLLLVENTKHDWIFELNDEVEDPASRLPRRASELDEQIWEASGFTEFLPQHDRLILSVGVPVYDEREVLGLLTLGYEINNSSLEDLLFVSRSDNILVLVNDRPLFTTMQNAEVDDLLKQLPGQLEKNVTYYVETRGEHYLVMAEPLVSAAGETSAQLVVTFSYSDDRKLLADISNALNLSAFGAFVIFSLVSIIFTGRITDQLNKLVGHVAALGEGRYGDPVEITAQDEVGVLANSFEELRVKLRNRTQALMDVNRDLDLRIREIASLNNVMVAIASNQPMESVFAVIAREAGKRIPVEYAYLALSDEAGNGELRLLAWHAEKGGPRQNPLLEPLPTLYTLAAEKGAFLLHDLDAKSRYVDESWMAQNGLTSAYLLPLLSGESNIGLLCLASTGDQRAAKDEQIKAFLEKLSTEITVALQRLRLNEELQLIESRLSRLFDSVRDGIFQTDSAGDLIFLNSAAQRMFNAMKPDEMKGLNLENLLVNQREKKELFRKLEKKGYVTNFPATMARLNEADFDAELSVNYTEGEKGSRGIEGIVRDVTQRKRLERELQRSEVFLRQIIEGTSNAIFTLDRQGCISFMNPQLAELTGYDEEKLMGFQLLELFDPDLKAEFADRLKAVLEEDQTFGGVEVALRKADGRASVGLLSLAPLKNQGEKRAAVGALSDISEIKKLEDYLIRSERLSSMGQIAASVAHEINNPLGIVLGFAQDLLAEKSKGDPDVEPLQAIEQETQRCARIVKDLLDLARAGETKRNPVDLAKLIEKTLALFKLHLRDGRIKLVKELSETPPVLGDEHQLQQILINVILNSIHAMAEKGGTLRITLAPVCPTDQRETIAMVCIEDTGYGIPEDDLDRIFDPFFTTKRGGGSGLGLFIVHRLVEAHGGRIAIESKLKKGTKCIINLPLAE